MTFHYERLEHGLIVYNVCIDTNGGVFDQTILMAIILAALLAVYVRGGRFPLPKPG